jgi:hypothetical protein
MSVLPRQPPARLLVIAGSAKAGTSALTRHLTTHPELVGGTKKEPRYFTRFAERTWTGPASEGFAESILTNAADYAANFPILAPGQWAIDASTDYLWCPDSPNLIRTYAQYAQVKVIVIVRDPIERAVSEYNHTLRHDWEPNSFAAALGAEPERMRTGWHPVFYHCRRSSVHADLHRFHDTFKDDLMIIDYADLKKPGEILHRISEFLGIAPFPEVEISQVNQSFLPRNQIAKRVLTSPALRSVAQIMVPPNIRKRIWQSLHASSRDVQTVSEPELQKMRALMSEEIEACYADPLIPTSNWRLSNLNSS